MGFNVVRLGLKLLNGVWSCKMGLEDVGYMLDGFQSY